MKEIGFFLVALQGFSDDSTLYSSDY